MGNSVVSAPRGAQGGNVRDKYTRRLVSIVGCGAALCAWLPVIQAQDASSVVNRNNIALYYQNDVPVDELQAFDVVVIDPSRANPPSNVATPLTRWLARLRVDTSEMTPDYIDRVVSPLWAQGYSGFLVDDGQPLGAVDEHADQALQQLIAAIRQTYPEASVILRNHLALADAIADRLDALVVDGVYGSASAYGVLQPPPQHSAKRRRETRLKDWKLGIPPCRSSRWITVFRATANVAASGQSRSRWTAGRPM